MKGVVNIRGKEYKTVALRVSEFREAFPIKDGWAIRTEIRELTDTGVIILATITDSTGHVVATGHGHERWNSSQINETSCVENCETSAIGRALAAAGFGGSEFASADELANAILQQSKKPTANPPSQQSDVRSVPFNKFAEWIEKNYAKSIRDGEPFESFDDIDAFIGSRFEITEPAGLTVENGETGEIDLDWDKLRACTDTKVFKALCEAIKAEAQRRMEGTFV